MEGKHEKADGVGGCACVFTCIGDVSLYPSPTTVSTAGFPGTFRKLTCVGNLLEGDAACRASACGGCEMLVFLEHLSDIY